MNTAAVFADWTRCRRRVKRKAKPPTRRAKANDPGALPAMTEPAASDTGVIRTDAVRSEEHTSELQSLMRISYAVFCLKKKRKYNQIHVTAHTYQHNNIPLVHRQHDILKDL